MAPRCGKRKYRPRNTIPMWIPLPRPCLRSMNLPGPQYYMPISPEMYLPPWTLPPSYFTKPICQCGNENYCTTSNCKNSTECLKMHPMICPHGTNHEETSDLQQNIGQNQQQNNDEHDSTSNSETNVCATCGAPPKKLRDVRKKSKLAKDDQRKPKHTSKVISTEDSSTSSHNLEQSIQAPKGINSERNKILNADKNLATRERNSTTEDNPASPNIMRSKGCINTSCQTSLSNSRSRGKNKTTISKKYNLNSSSTDKRCSQSSTNYPNDSGNSADGNDSTSSDTHKAPIKVTRNDFGCNTCGDQNNSPVNVLDKPLTNSKTDITSKELAVTTKKSVTDNIHVDQLPVQLSNARKRNANKYSGCCFTGSDKKNCKTAVNVDAVNEPVIEVPYSDNANPRKKSECNDAPGKESSKSRKLSQCLCSSTKIPLKQTSRCRKMSKCECSPNKTSHKHKSKSQVLSECGCSTTKINSKTNSRNVSECLCPSTDKPLKAPMSRKTSENGFSSSEGNIPKACSSKITTKKSNKSFKETPRISITNVKQSSCQCKFPPAYEHLSCTGNPNCDCANNV